jgi:hypothetical protein
VENRTARSVELPATTTRRQNHAVRRTNVMNYIEARDASVTLSHPGWRDSARSLFGPSMHHVEPLRTSVMRRRSRHQSHLSRQSDQTFRSDGP